LLKVNLTFAYIKSVNVVSDFEASDRTAASEFLSGA